MTSMPQSDTEKADATADNLVVLGVDTHKDVHVAAVISMLGVFLASQSFPTTAAGYEQMLAWARTFGTVRQAGVECTGSYGAALTRYLRVHHVSVIEVNQPDKATRRNAARPTPSTPRPLRELCCPAGPPPSRRPATGRSR